MEYLSFYLYLQQCLSLMSGSFQYAGFSLLWLHFFSRYFILFYFIFDAIVNGFAFLISLSELLVAATFSQLEN